jgi:hypothetical protein
MEAKKAEKQFYGTAFARKKRKSLQTLESTRSRIKLSDSPEIKLRLFFEQIDQRIPGVAADKRIKERWV